MIRDISNLRKSYSKNSIVENDLPKDPFFLFDTWFKQVSSKNKKLEVSFFNLKNFKKVELILRNTNRFYAVKIRHFSHGAFKSFPMRPNRSAWVRMRQGTSKNL